jgi:hypothetical protein
VSGSTIFLGNLQLKEISATEFGVFTADGTTTADLDVGNIDVAALNQGTSTIGIAELNGNAFITVGGVGNVLLATTAGVEVTGNLGVTGNVDVAGTTIFLGDLQLKAQDANTFVVYKSDGVTQANIDVGSIDVTGITQGNSEIGIAAPGGNAFITVGGVANVVVIDTQGVDITGNLSVSGDVVAQNVNSLSDATLKTNILPLTGFESVINSLTGVEYDWKNGSGHSYGLLAQDVEKVIPSAVKTDDAGLKSVNYQMIIPFLIETIKSLGSEINELKKVIGK